MDKMHRATSWLLIFYITLWHTEQTGPDYPLATLLPPLLRSHQKPASGSLSLEDTSGSSMNPLLPALTRPWRMTLGAMYQNQKKVQLQNLPLSRLKTHSLCPACWLPALSTTTCCMFGDGTGARKKNRECLILPNHHETPSCFFYEWHAALQRTF